MLGRRNIDTYSTGDAPARKMTRAEKLMHRDRYRAERRAAHRRPSVSTIVAVMFVIVGACLIAYPSFANWWNERQQIRTINDYVKAVDNTDKETIEALLADAHKYNEDLLNVGNRFNMTDEERERYNSILNITGDGVIGFIQIGSIGVNLPVYHGVDDEILQTAIGHIEGTSIPVGGPSTHSAVSGHRGLPSARLFTDLDRLVEGDTFTMSVLNEVYTYEVDQIHIVEPGDLSDLSIDLDKDYMTLVTCTPYAINTHRLLVRGHRIDNITGTVVIPPEAIQIPNYIAVPAVGLPMLFTYLVGALIYYRGKGEAPDLDRALEELREQAGSGRILNTGKSESATAGSDSAISDSDSV